MRRLHRIIGTLGVAIAIVSAPAVAMSLEEVVAKHVDARGGSARWEKVDSMKITGSFTGFSLVGPFTSHRKRGDKYHMDFVLGDKKMLVGSDGETVWWDNAWRQPGPRPVEEPDLGVIRRDLEFATPMFDYKERGHTIKLLGDVEIEGIPAIGLELTRDDESVETWYLDPKTYLEIARESPGSDFGRPMDQRTFYDDFRNVDGLVVPHLVEAQWYTRDRVMRIESIETNLEIDDALFQMPFPMGMGPLRSLIGEWSVASSRRDRPDAEWEESERTSKIEALMRGAILREHFVTREGTEVIRTVSYDPYREAYRLTEINDRLNFMDVREGLLGEEGRLVLSNVETNTPMMMFGMTIHLRTSIFDISEDGFQMEQEASTDGGENWFVASKATYSRGAE